MGACLEPQNTPNYIIALAEIDNKPVVKLNFKWRTDIELEGLYKIKFIHDKPNYFWTLCYNNGERTIPFSEIDRRSWAKERYVEVFNFMLQVCNEIKVKIEFSN